MDSIAFTGEDVTGTRIRIEEFSAWNDPAAAVAPLCWCFTDDVTGEDVTL
jgi:hypothetical protein